MAKWEPYRREFDLALELVTPSVPESAYRYVPGGVYATDGDGQYRYDAYQPTAAADHAPPVVVFVHGDGPAEFLREPRLWGQYRSWAALAAANGMAAITFDHRSSEGRTKIEPVLDQIHLLLDRVEQEAHALGIDPRRVAVWSGSAGVPFGFVAALDHPSVRCHVAFYGPMDLRTDDSRTAPGVSADVLAEHSPITHLERRRGQIQPLFIAKAGLDRPGINASIDAFVSRAGELGGPVTLETHPDGRHAFDILDDDDRSREIIERTIQFMRAYLLT
ncbi:MAG: hypothetical protein H0V12_10340 [Chloroflexi bacterium]|nr:hypothetical protein [Chloroflexota bacterium]